MIRRLFLLVFVGIFASCSSVRFEPLATGECYEHLGRCALNEHGLTKVTIAAMKQAGLSQGDLKRAPYDTLAGFEKKVGRDRDSQQALVEQCIDAANHLREGGETDRAMGLYLVAAEHTLPFLHERTSASGVFFAHAHQYATARVVELLNQRRIAVGIPAFQGAFRLRVNTVETEDRVNPFRFDSLMAADSVQVNGFRERVNQLGLGAPFVAGKNPLEDPDVRPYFPLGGLYQPLTAVLSFKGRQVTLTFYDSLREDSLRVGGKELPLATDYSASWARFVDEDPNKKAFLGLFRPGEADDIMRLTLTEPFREDAIPVIFVHGLASSGATWDETINGLLADPVIRERYQFWIYQYPSGYPFLYPAADLRRTIREVRLHFDPADRLPVLDRIVLIGHSMGGLISSAQIRRTDDAAMHQFFKHPLDQLSADQATKNRLRDLLYMSPEGYIRRAIFVATPHRGSTIADSWIGRLTSRLIKLPNDVLTLNLTGIVQEITDTGLSMIDLAPNSVTRLKYSNPVLRTLSELPIDERVTFHTICGDRGLGNAPASSDGVVSYASSHLEGATSEKIVGSWHSAHRHPDAIDEIRRILTVHLN